MSKRVTLIGKQRLRAKIVRSLRAQGFSVRDGHLKPFDDIDKSSIRALHSVATRHRILEARDRLLRHEPELLSWIANGVDIVPSEVSPRLVRVHRGSVEELLFRYAKLHWSIPVSSGYGRRLRYLVIDDSNDKLIGLIGLGDPVINLGARDTFIGWNASQKAERLRHVLDAFVLGAVPPYSFLLCGKLVAMLAASSHIREDFARQYGG
jgi:hypothetical protein